MTIQTINDAIVAKGADLDTLLSKADPTMDDVTAIKAIGEELQTLKSQLSDLEAVEALRKSHNATKTTTTPQATNDVKVSVKGHRAESLPAEKKSQFIAGRFIQATMKGSETAKQDLADLGVEYKTHVESIDSVGGILVPQEVSAYIIDLKEQYGAFRRNVRVENMTSDTKLVYRMGDDITAYWGAETGTLSPSDMTFNGVNLNAKKLYAMAVVSDELNADASIDLGARFAVSVARQFAKKEDEAGFNGDGTSTYGGITGVRTALTNLDGTVANIAGLQVGSGNLYSEIVLADFIATKGKLPGYARANARWYFNKAAFAATAESLTLAAGGVLASEIINGYTLDRFLGFPVELVDVMPGVEANSQVFALFGDLSLAATMGDRQAVGIRADLSAGFTTDTIYIKATERVDIVVHDVGNASGTAANRVAGPIVGLITAAS